MKKRANIVIRMGASKFTVDVRAKDGSMINFDMNKMNRKQQNHFRKELVVAFREAGV
jgi:hypothetical protein